MDTIDWNRIYPQLYAYTESLLESYHWFRTDKTDSYLKGQQVEDYVLEAITRYLTHPEKFDESSGRSLVNYIKRHIILTLVGNDARLTENKVSAPLFVEINSEDEDDESYQLNPELPFCTPGFEKDIDHQTIMSEIEKEVQHDEILKKIFEGYYRDAMTRGEVLKEDCIPPNEYDKGKKRLDTIIRKIARKYDIIQTQ